MRQKKTLEPPTVESAIKSFELMLLLLLPYVFTAAVKNPPETDNKPNKEAIYEFLYPGPFNTSASKAQMRFIHIKQN